MIIRKKGCKNMNDVMEKFIENAKMYNENLNLGNSRVANKAAKVLSKMSEKMIEQKTYFTLVDELLNNEDPGVRYWTSSIALITGYKRKGAISVILSMSKNKNKNIGLISVSARIAAEECKKKGWIK